MIGEGSTFPNCPQHQVANLKGSTDGSYPVLTGAVVNGPNDPGQFDDGLGDYQDGMVACPPGGHDRTTPSSAATVAGSSTTYGPGRPTSRRWT